MSIVGIARREYIDLTPFLSLEPLSAIDEEITYQLAKVSVNYTGGSHLSMGIMPPSFASQEKGADYGHVLQSMTASDAAKFYALGDLDEDDEEEHEEVVSPLQYGEERPKHLSKKQMLFLKYRFGVYFPWKVYYEMIPNHYWDEKSSSVGKHFTDEALLMFPRTVAFVQSLPFRQIGRCNIMGLEANDYGTVHRDGNHHEKPMVDHFITFCPQGNKRLFLWSEEEQRKVYLSGHAYWFNDSDYHGVEADPFFRYSVRVDGVFKDSFLKQLEAYYGPLGR